MEFKGMVTNKPEIVSGTSERGDWKRATVVVNDAQSGLSLAGNVWGEKAEKFMEAYKAETRKVIPGNLWNFKIVPTARQFTDKDGNQRWSTEINIVDFQNIASL